MSPFEIGRPTPAAFDGTAPSSAAPDGDRAVDSGRRPGSVRPVCHVLHGLRLHASHPVPGLPLAPRLDRADVTLQLETPAGQPRLPDAPPWFATRLRDERGVPALRIWRSPGGYRLVHAGGHDVWVDEAGQVIRFLMPASADPSTTTALLTGFLLRFLLRLRGVTFLHASVAAIDGRAVAFVGPGGAGKSTTATALALRGHRLLTDDVAVVRRATGGYLVEPGGSQVRLLSPTVDWLFAGGGEIPPLVPGPVPDHKRRVDVERLVPGAYQTDPLPLAALYLLAPRLEGPACPRATPLSARETFEALVTHVPYPMLLEKPARAREYGFLLALSSVVPGRRLSVPNDIERLSGLCDAVARDVVESGGQPAPRC